LVGWDDAELPVFSLEKENTQPTDKKFAKNKKLNLLKLQLPKTTIDLS
jgi:hypothetical protein